MLGSIFERFVQHSPLSVMARGLMERVFAPEKLDGLFESTARVQYTRELLFSSVVEMMSLVVCAIYPSVNAAYRAKAQELGVSRTALYNKLNGIEPQVSAAMVRDTAREMVQIIETMAEGLPDWVEGYQTRISDGTCLAGTDHRLEVLQEIAAKALPGKCLVVLDPKLKLVRDVFILVSSNILAVVQAALGWVHGMGKVEAGISLYYVVDEVQATYRGMMIAIEPSAWSCFETCSLEQLLTILHQLAAQVRLANFLKQPRAAKQPKSRPKRDPKQGHVSTQRLLQKKKNTP